MRKLLSLITATLFSLWIAPTQRTEAAGSDWPQWRGPHRDGVSPEKGLLDAWPEGGPSLAWKTRGLGAGYSGVSVVDGKLFTMGDGPETSFIFARKESDGGPIWQAKVGKTGGGEGYPGPRCTPTVDGDLVVALGQFGDLVCVESATGTERWRKNLEKDFAGEMMSGWGYAESPLVDGDRVVCTPGGAQGTLVALNKSNGAVLWRTKGFTDPAAYCSIIIAEIDGKRQYVQLTDASVVGVAPEDGKILWRAPRRGSTAVIATPIVYDNCVYVTSSYGAGCNLFRIIESSGQFKAESVYENKSSRVMSNHHGGVVRVGDQLYGYSDGKGWVCQDFKTGKMLWSEKQKLGKGSLCYADGHLYLRSEDKGTMALVAASPDGYKESGRFEQPNRSELKAWPHPVIAHGKLFLRDQDVLLCYKIQK
jgi:outer membrane protein assembly factor BamB